MRRLAVFLAFSFFFSCSSSNSSVNLGDEGEVRKALVGSWESTYLETRATRSQVPNDMVSIITFKADGTVESKLKGGEIVTKSKWNYNPKLHQILQTYEQGTFETPVVRLTGGELILTGYTKSNDRIVDSSISTFKKL